MKIDPEFNQAFACIDAELALAYLFARRPNLFIVRPQQSERPKICIEVRRSLCLSYDLAAASDAIWRFRPHEEHRKHFIYEHVRALDSQHAEILADSCVYLYTD